MGRLERDFSVYTGRMHFGRVKRHGSKAIDRLIYAAAVGAPLALVPQAVQIYTTHSVAGLSYPTWALLAALNALWVLYGFAHRERPIILSNAAFVALDLAILSGIFLYQ